MILSRMSTSTSSIAFLVSLVWSVAISADSVAKSFAFVQEANNHRHRVHTDLAQEINRLKQMSKKVNVLSFSAYSSSSSFLLAEKNQAEDADPDLFDYFDPLLSPHAYPSGISPDNKPHFKSNDEVQTHQQKLGEQTENRGLKGDFGIALPNREQTEEKKSPSSVEGILGFEFRANPTSSSKKMEENQEKEEEDLFDYFDPLRSPHEYPDGIKSKKDSMLSNTAPPALQVVSNDEEDISAKSFANPSRRADKKKKVGVLLMDHGSKKEKSNARLQTMAELYQMTLGIDDDEKDDVTPRIIVRAAHMEIAKPSIPDGLKELKDLGVDEIICHPFFLSADGRHVKEDIPEIIENAIEDLWGKNTDASPIPVVTTAPVGSNTQLMLGAIHSLVRENSQYLKTSLQNEF